MGKGEYREEPRTFPAYLTHSEYERQRRQEDKMIEGFLKWNPTEKIGETPNFSIEIDRKQKTISIKERNIMVQCPFKLSIKPDELEDIIKLLIKGLGELRHHHPPTNPKVQKTKLVTFLAKSEKHGKICLACVDENGQWIRPIKPGGFDEKDILMDNGKLIQLFDVVDMKLGAPFPIKHHKENILTSPRADIKFVKRLGENEKNVLLSKIANSRILNTVSSRKELYNELVNNLNQSLVLAGPINVFDIQCNAINGKKHPKIWIVGENDKQPIFSVTCTDIEFCKFIRNKSTYLKENGGTINSQDIPELKGKPTYFVIGLTGDSLDEDNRIKDGKYAPPGSSIQPRYWPLIVSVLTIPSYSGGD
jgi:hypothetical protein